MAVVQEIRFVEPARLVSEKIHVMIMHPRSALLNKVSKLKKKETEVIVEMLWVGLKVITLYMLKE